MNVASDARTAERPRKQRAPVPANKRRRGAIAQMRSVPAGRDKGEAARRHIVETANRLFYELGYNQTSFSDIADAAGIPRGNFYYYFKTKDEILLAVVDFRLENSRAMLAQWEAATEKPAERIVRFTEMLRGSARDLSRYGCSMGSLNIELGKAQPVLKAKARELFDLFRDWLTVQLVALGVKDADELALHLLGRAQGIAVMTQVYSDTKLLNKEIDQLEEWLLRRLPARARRA